MKTQTQLLRKTALAAAVALVVGGVASVGGFMGIDTGMSSIVSSAYAAQGDSAGGGHKGAMGEGRGGQGGQGAGAGGQGQRGGKSMTDVLSDEGEEEDSDRPAWAGVPGRDGKPGGGNAGGSTKKGGDYGDLFVILRNDDGTPVPAPEGEFYILLANGEVVVTEGGEVPAGTDLEQLQAVEFGRMNIARSPESVLEHSLTEALSKLDGLVIDASNIAELTDASGRLLTTDKLTIDSPLENLALYEALLTAVPNDDGKLVVTATSSHDGADTTYTLLVDPSVRLDLAASAIAASSDKTGELSIDEIVLISSFMGVDDELGALVGDYSYDRTDTYNVTVNVLVEQPDGSYVPTDVNLFETLTADDGDIYGFNEVVRLVLQPDGSLLPDSNTTGIDVFTQAADDAVQAIEFVHEFDAP